MPRRSKPTPKKRPKRRLSRKLREGAAILEGERYGDLEPGFLADQVKRGRVKSPQIYKAVQHFGYRWRNGGWQLLFPRWLETLIAREEEEILQEFEPVARARLRTISNVSRRYR